jgi:hypothetical protein
VTERKRPATGKDPQPVDIKDVKVEVAALRRQLPEVVEKEPGLHGWFGLFLRVCVYFTAALCVELLLHAFENWIDEGE